MSESETKSLIIYTKESSYWYHTDRSVVGSHNVLVSSAEEKNIIKHTRVIQVTPTRTSVWYD